MRVPAGLRLYLSTSQSTSLLGSFLNGSLNMAAGIRNMSLLEPSDWYVLDPSKFHSGRSGQFKSVVNFKFLKMIFNHVLWCFLLMIQEWDLTLDRLGLRVQSSGLAAKSLSRTIDPDVHGLDLVPLREAHVLLLDSFVQLWTGWGGHFSWPWTPAESEEDELRTLNLNIYKPERMSCDSHKNVWHNTMLLKKKNCYGNSSISDSDYNLSDQLLLSLTWPYQ